MGSPNIPTAAQWATLKADAQLTYDGTPDTETLAQQTFSKKFHLNTYGVELVNLTSVTTTGTVESKSTFAPFGPRISLEKNRILISGCKAITVFNLQGKTILSLRGSGSGYFSIDRNRLGIGTFIIADDAGVLPGINPIVLTR
jgi:hypothetical protein